MNPPLRTEQDRQDLHSNMDRLKQIEYVVGFLISIYLHSNMDRLKRVQEPPPSVVLRDLHSNMDRLKPVADGLCMILSSFTFQYG